MLILTTVYIYRVYCSSITVQGQMAHSLLHGKHVQRVIPSVWSLRCTAEEEADGKVN